jgi:predicted GNAT family acetyltransferase
MHTLKEFRGRGYGKAIASTWTREVLKRKLTPFLETDVDNHSALKIYRSLGYKEIGESCFFEKGSAIVERLCSRV